MGVGGWELGSSSFLPLRCLARGRAELGMGGAGLGARVGGAGEWAVRPRVGVEARGELGLHPPLAVPGTVGRGLECGAFRSGVDPARGEAGGGSELAGGARPEVKS